MKTHSLKEVWLSEGYQRIFSERNGKHSSNEDELKKDYQGWFEEKRIRLVDLDNRRFKKSNLDDIISFLEMHPLADKFASKEIKRIKKESRYSFGVFVVKCYMLVGLGCAGWLVLKRKTTVKQYIINNRMRYFMGVFGLYFFLALNLRKSMTKRYFWNGLEEKGYIKKYFEEFDESKI